MQPPSVDTQTMQEALRQRAFGSDVNSPPLENTTPGMSFQGGNPAMPAGGASGGPTDQAQSRLGQEKKESVRIIEALDKRLKVLGDRGE